MLLHLERNRREESGIAGRIPIANGPIVVIMAKKQPKMDMEKVEP
jgi:hypothetical protein